MSLLSLNQIRVRWYCCLIMIIWIPFVCLLSTCVSYFQSQFRLTSLQDSFSICFFYILWSLWWLFTWTSLHVWLFALLPCLIYSVSVCLRIKKNADGSIFCVCCVNLCVTNPSGTVDRGCDKNSHSLNLLKRKKYQNVANKRSRNS